MSTEINRLTLNITASGIVYEVGGPFSAQSIVSEIQPVDGGYKVVSNNGTSTIFRSRYVKAVN